MAPVPNDPWDDIRNATTIHTDCPQRNIYTRAHLQPAVGNEDCLYLNVYTPKLPQEDKSLLPVMVFFHGGGWLCGGGNSNWYAPSTLLDRDVVLVSPNYRLGPLGFFTTGDEVVPGNNGLKDQLLVLKWIQKNIDRFGGDPDSVTIFGESAGGASVHYHILSPSSKGLFHRAISHSGTALCTWAFSPKNEGLTNSLKLAELLKCPTKDSKEMIKCLRKVDARKIIEQDVQFMEWDTDPMIPFKPVIEPNVPGAFITKDPIDIIKSGHFAQVPWIIGINSEDGALRAVSLYANNLIEEFNNNFDTIAPYSLFYDKTSPNPEYVTEQIRRFYFADNSIDGSTKENVTNMYTDNWFLIGADESIQLHLKYGNHPLYYYLFGYKGVLSFSAAFGDPVNDYGVIHVDELLYLFPIQFGPDKVRDERDRQQEYFMTTLWTNFAKTGNPTPEVNDIIQTQWSPVTGKGMEYYFIKEPVNSVMRRGLYSERAEFWRSLPVDPRWSKVAKDEL